ITQRLVSKSAVGLHYDVSIIWAVNKSCARYRVALRSTGERQNVRRGHRERDVFQRRNRKRVREDWTAVKLVVDRNVRVAERLTVTYLVDETATVRVSNRRRVDKAAVLM